MAVVDKYVDVDLEADKLGSALFTNGKEVTFAMATVAVAAGDDNDSVYRLFKDVPSSLVPVLIIIHNTAITNGTDYDLGLYKINRGAVIDKDILADGLDMSSARAIATLNNAGLTTLNIANGGEDLGKLSAQTDIDPAYDIALTANTVGTIAGTIRATAVFAYK